MIERHNNAKPSITTKGINEWSERTRLALVVKVKVIKGQTSLWVSSNNTRGWVADYIVQIYVSQLQTNSIYVSHAYVLCDSYMTSFQASVVTRDYALRDVAIAVLENQLRWNSLTTFLHNCLVAPTALRKKKAPEMALIFTWWTCKTSAKYKIWRQLQQNEGYATGIPAKDINSTTNQSNYVNRLALVLDHSSFFFKSLSSHCFSDSIEYFAFCLYLRLCSVEQDRCDRDISNGNFTLSWYLFISV